MHFIKGLVRPGEEVDVLEHIAEQVFASADRSGDALGPFWLIQPGSAVPCFFGNSAQWRPGRECNTLGWGNAWRSASGTGPRGERGE